MQASPAMTVSSSPLASTRSSPVHPASLVDPSTHSPELMQLLDIHFSPRVIDYVVACVADTVDYAFGQPSAPPSQLSSFKRLVSSTLSYADVSPATLLVTLVYIARARPHLSIALAQWARERVFLGALIAASKYTQDSTLKNAHWALVSGVFGTGDIGRIEREFLEVLDWELGVREGDVLALHAGLVAAAASNSPQTPLSISRQRNPAPQGRRASAPARTCPRTRALLPAIQRGQPLPAHAPFSFPFSFAFPFAFPLPLPFAAAYIRTRHADATCQKTKPWPKTAVRPPAARDAPPRTWALPAPCDLGGVARDRVAATPTLALALDPCPPRAGAFRPSCSAQPSPAQRRSVRFFDTGTDARAR
ncbi:hypothetical protein B0H13DRAFT_1059428 [Mycena leptocephala]|nr:hypothetical protein B0H13DRAFT_1059428 [Mycena leptocephala]